MVRLYARSAEFDPIGRNVADPGPYVTLNDTPPASDGDPRGGIDLFPSGGGYRPNQSEYYRDGVRISADEFLAVVNSGWVGGLFGLLEMSARMSTREVGRWYKTWPSPADTDGVSNTSDDEIFAPGENSQLVSIEYERGWEFSGLLTWYKTDGQHVRGEDDIGSNEFAVKLNAKALLNDPSWNCTRALQRAGLLDSVKDKLPIAKFVSLAEEGNNLASNYFSDALPSETLNGMFLRIHQDTSKAALANKKAIVTPYGALSFLSGSLPENAVPWGFFIHELVHHATDLSDVELAERLLSYSPTTKDEASLALSNYFNKNCPIEDGKPPPSPKRIR